MHADRCWRPLLHWRLANLKIEFSTFVLWNTVRDSLPAGVYRECSILDLWALAVSRCFVETTLRRKVCAIRWRLTCPWSLVHGEILKGKPPTWRIDIAAIAIAKLGIKIDECLLRRRGERARERSASGESMCSWRCIVLTVRCLVRTSLLLLFVDA
jgi:hypothetical protein